MNNLARSLFYALPTKWRFIVRRLLFLPIDTFEYIIGKRRPPYPPKGLIFTGSGDFKKQGDNLLAEFIKYGKLKPTDTILDIGSGIGRLAIPLTSFLAKNGRYEGFDIVERGVRWCQKHITNKHPNFNFKYVPLLNDLYTEHEQKAEAFTFPYPDNTFDKVVLLSVFTHMTPTEVDNYMKEIHRVLKKGGLCYATFFVMNEESKKLMKAPFTFPHEYEQHYLMSQEVQGANVAYKEAFLRNHLIEKNGLQLQAIHTGWWCGRKKSACVQFQDVVVFGK